MKEKIYLVRAHEIYGETSLVLYAYRDKEKAEHHVELLQQMQGDFPDEYYCVSEVVLNDDNFSLDQKVVPYYSYVIQLEEDEENLHPDEYNNDEKEMRIYEGDNIIIEKDDYRIYYSTKSYQDAREQALQFYMDHFQ